MHNLALLQLTYPRAHVVMAATGSVKGWDGINQDGPTSANDLAHVAGKGIRLEWVDQLPLL